MNDRNESPSDMSALLDVLYRKSGCFYLSDLHEASFMPAISAAVSRLDASAYSLNAWNGAAGYILRRECTFSDACEAREELRQALMAAAEADRQAEK